MTRGSGALAPLRNHRFAALWAGAIVSNVGSWMQTLTVPYVVYEMTGSSLWLSASAAASYLPMILMASIGGAIADRHPRGKVLVVTLSLEAGGAVALWLLWSLGRPSVLVLLGLQVWCRTAGGLKLASWQAFVPSVVARSQLVSAVRLNSMQFAVARAVGPAVGAVVLGRFGPSAAFGVNSATFVPIIVVVALAAARSSETPAGHGSMLARLRGGAMFVKHRRHLRQALLTAVVMSSLPLSLVQLGPAIAREQFGVGGSGYGTMMAAFGVGSVVIGIVVAVVADRWTRSRTTLAGLAVSTAGAVVLALPGTGYVAAAAAMALLGAGQSAVTMTASSAVQLQVRDQFKGRVLSVLLLANLGGIPVGTFLLSLLSTVGGTRLASATVAVGVASYAWVAGIRTDRLTTLDADESAVEAARVRPQTPAPPPAEPIDRPTIAAYHATGFGRDERRDGGR